MTEKNLSILSVKERLLQGNQRYMKFKPVYPHQTVNRLKEIETGQKPFAVLISCSDSRVPPEIIFDQGLGDLFIIRTAGNVLGDYEIASIEYAVLKLNCKAIMIMGHENCGAIESFIEHPSDNLPGHLNSLVNFIRQQPNAHTILTRQEDRNYHAVINNIIYGIKLLKNESEIVREKYDNHELEIYGAIYHLSNGKINIISEDVNP